MKIDKNWFYELSNTKIEKNKIEIADNLTVTIFSSQIENYDFYIWENTFAEIYFLIDSSLKDISKIKINTFQNKPSSKLKLHVLILSKDKNNSKIEVKSEIWSKKTITNTKILSIASENGFIDLDGIIKINKWVKQAKARLEEENIFLWDSWKIKWIPTLLVESNDVEASHACKIEKISDEKLFYLRSRWFMEDDATSMMIKWKIIDLFKCVNMLDKWFFDKLIENTLNKIIN